MKEAIGIEVTFTLKTKLQKYVLQQNMIIFLATVVSFLNR